MRRQQPLRRLVYTRVRDAVRFFFIFFFILCFSLIKYHTHAICNGYDELIRSDFSSSDEIEVNGGWFFLWPRNALIGDMYVYLLYKRVVIYFQSSLHLYPIWVGVRCFLGIYYAAPGGEYFDDMIMIIIISLFCFFSLVFMNFILLYHERTYIGIS